MNSINTDAIVVDLAPSIPRFAATESGVPYPGGLPPGTPSPVLAREGAVLEGQLLGDEQELPGGHGRDGLEAATVQHALSPLDAFAQELDRLLPR